MQRFKLMLGMLWASPITLLFFIFYVFPMWVFGYYRFEGWKDVAWVWRFQVRGLRNSGVDGIVLWSWKRWSGHTLGNIIVVRVHSRLSEISERTLTHEKEHVVQAMRLGVFHPIAYAIVYAIGRWVLRNSDGYYDNIFEIDARRAAGQLIDALNATNRLKNR